VDIYTKENEEEPKIRNAILYTATEDNPEVID